MIFMATSRKGQAASSPACPSKRKPKRPRTLVRGLNVIAYVLLENFPLINSLSVEIENNTFAGRRRAAGTLNFQA